MNTFARVRNAKPEEGAALLTAIVILLALTIMGFAMILVTKVDLNVSRNLRLAEQALFAAEQGGLAATIQIEKEYLDMDVGQTFDCDPAKMPCPGVAPTWGSPVWDFRVTKEGYAPKAGRSSVDISGQQVNYYQYRIQSRGSSGSRAERSIELLVRMRQIESGGTGYRRIAYIH